MRNIEQLTLLPELNECSPGEGSPDLQPLRDDGGCDQLVLGHFLVQFLVCGLVEQHLVVKLVTNFSFGPLLQSQKKYQEISTSLL